MSTKAQNQFSNNKAGTGLGNSVNMPGLATQRQEGQKKEVIVL